MMNEWKDTDTEPKQGVTVKHDVKAIKRSLYVDTLVKNVL